MKLSLTRLAKLAVIRYKRCSQTYYAEGMSHTDLVKDSRMLSFINMLIDGNISIPPDSIISADPK